MAKIPNFENDYTGLSHAEINENAQMFGKNSSDQSMRKYNASMFLQSALRPIIVILLVCALICLVFKAFGAALASIIIIAFYLCADFFINKKISADAQTFHDSAVRKVTAVRCDEIVSVPSDMLLPSDIIYLKEGEIVPCDCVVLEEHDLTVNESILSGANVSVIKTSETDNSASKLKANYLYCGSLITGGDAVCKVVATGKRTLCARNGTTPQSAPLRPSKSEKWAKAFAEKAEWLSIVPFVVCFFVFFVIKVSGNNYTPAIYGSALSLSLIPSLLPVAISLLNYHNIKAQSRKNRQVINYYASDDCGEIDVICVDKTGIITANKPKIAEIYTENKQIFAHISTLACDKNSPSTLDDIILEFCEEVGADVPIIQSNYLLHTFPFSSAEKMSAFVWKISDDTVLAAKGSPEEILKICKLTDAEKSVIATRQEEFAKKGYSVIAVAYKDIPAGQSLASAISRENGLEFAGLFAISDPPRASITDAVENCKQNNIKLIMITGDNPDTALSVATSIGIDTSGGILSGEEIENCTEESISDLIKSVNVFARVSPDTKLKIVSELQKDGNKVCVVGENKDDIAVLQTADVGISIGEEPSEYALGASDIWVKNNSLDEITNTVIDCKKNMFALKKAIAFNIDMQIVLFVTNLFALIFASKSSVLEPAFMPLGIMLAQIMILALTITVYSNYKEKLSLSRSKIADIVVRVIRVASIFCVTFLAYKLFLGSAHLDNINIEDSFGSARCFAFMTFAFIIITSAFNYYSDEYFTTVSFIRSIRKPLVLAATLATLCLIAVVSFIQPISGIFGLYSIGIMSFFLALALSFIPVIISDLIKAVKK